MYEGFISGLYSVPLVYMSVLKLVPHFFYDCIFVINFEIRKCEACKFLFYFKIILAIEGYNQQGLFKIPAATSLFTSSGWF